VAAFKAEQWEPYVKCIAEAQKAYGELLAKRTKEVCAFLDISPENW
jgi:hypothetical protein